MIQINSCFCPLVLIDSNMCVRYTKLFRFKLLPLHIKYETVTFIPKRHNKPLLTGLSVKFHSNQIADSVYFHSSFLYLSISTLSSFLYLLSLLSLLNFINYQADIVIQLHSSNIVREYKSVWVLYPTDDISTFHLQ